jgi:hypothetical protein
MSQPLSYIRPSESDVGTVKGDGMSRQTSSGAAIPVIGRV